MFDKYAGKFRAEQRELEAELEKTGYRVSNLEQCVQNAINLSSKLATVWDLSDYKGKQELQFLLFPDGIYYNRKTEGCRTPKVNEVFSYISSLQRALGQKESGNPNHRLDVPAWVDPLGVEPRSKHMPDKLSTCLFRHWISEVSRSRTNQLNPYITEVFEQWP